MFKLILGGILLTLTACTTADDLSNSILPEGQSGISRHLGDGSTAVIGISVRDPPRILGMQKGLRVAWIQFDPQTNKRIGDTVAMTVVSCVLTSACDNSTDYKIYSLPPGSYALGWMIVGDELYQASHFTSMTKEYMGIKGYGGFMIDATGSKEADVPTSAPRFIVTQGAIDYVGDIVISFDSAGRISFEEKQSDQGARQALGPEFASQMVTTGWANSGPPAP